jgi:sec-independent protein translocase protein TatB
LIEEAALILFIFESIGTSELILIGVVALIFLGPRKLPQIARTIGKTLADLRNTTNEFKATWEREVDFEEEARALRTGELGAQKQESIPRSPAIPSIGVPVPTPSIKPIESPIDPGPQPTLFEDQKQNEPDTGEPASETPSDKRSWL